MLAAIDAGRAVADGAASDQPTPSTVRRWIRPRARTGAWRVRPYSGRPRTLAIAREATLIAQVTVHPDATVDAHCERWQTATGVRVSVSTMGRWLRRLGLTGRKGR